MRALNTLKLWIPLPLLFLGVVTHALTQNIVPNPSFEVYTTCPTGFGAGGPLPAQPWKAATAGSVDYFNECAANSSNVDVPDNYFGSQTAHTGVAYAGGYYRLSSFTYREYLLAPLDVPMNFGSSYDVSYWVSLGGHYCGTTQLGVYFSVNPPPSGGTGVLNVTPQFVANIGFVSDTTNWVLIEGCYVPSGGEQWITIGNFSSDANTPLDPLCNTSLSTYYYVDDVSVVEGGPAGTLPLDLGAPVTACSFYEIDPGISGVNFFWEGGSTQPTLTVTQSGTYSLTITSGCSIGVDSIDVTIHGLETVEIGPPETTICNGDSYDISLDPTFGNYTWQDGSTDPNYSITSSGLYQVTLDDGCQITTDQIMVTVIDPPAPFTLGPDVQLCSGDQIEFNFDQNLGDFMWQDGSDHNYYSITEPGSYSLTISNMCGQFVDDLEVEGIMIPVVYLGPEDLYLCPGDNYDIVLDPNMGDFIWQDGSDFNYYTISAPGIYAVTVSNPCGTTTQDINVFYGVEPVIDLGQDLVLCPAQLPYTLFANNIPDATYSWQNGSTDPDIDVTGPGIYSVTVTTNCFSVNDDVEVTVVDDSPEVDLPPDQMLCQGQTFTLDGNGVTGEYLWQDGSTGLAYTVSGPGIYSLTITNACGTGADSITVDYMPDLLPPDLGPDASLCPGETLVLYANVAGVNITWQDLSSADSLLVTLPGTYSLQIANMCSDASDTVVVSLNNNPPSLNLPASIDLCSGDTAVINSGISGVQFLWNSGSQASSISVFTPGLYSLTVSNSCGSDADTVIVNDAGSAPTVSLGQDISLCAGDASLITPASSDVISWLWQDGSTGPDYNVTGPGQLTVQVSNNCGVSYDTLISTLLPAVPVLQLGPDVSLCPGSPLTFNINTPNVSILWSDGSTGSNFNVVGSGLIYATISNVCGSSSDSVDITYLPDAPTLDLGIDQSLCPGDVITLSPGVAGVTYLWQDGSTSPSFNATQGGSIILTISNICGSATDTLEITENSNGPQVDLGPDISMCAGSVVTLNAGIAGVNYLWQDGSTNADFTTSISGTFILQVSNSCGVDLDTVNVDISGTPPEPDLGRDTLLCEGVSIVLSANPDAGSSVQWQDGSTSSTYHVTSAGSYIVSASNHCGNASDTINVAYQPAPEDFNLGPDTILCPGESFILTAPQTNASITWEDGSHGTSMMADQAIVYSLQLTNDCGSTSDSLLVGIDQRVPAINIDSTIPWCEGDVVTLDATQSFNAAYLWSNGSVNPSIEVTSPGLYSISVVTDCQSTQQDVNVVPGDDCSNDIHIPNIFSPNGDQVNDVFSLSFGSSLQVVTLSCSIFDRWGNMVFNTHEINFQWDGRFGNSILEPGVYVYVIDLTYVSAGKTIPQLFGGDVTLVR